MHVFLKGDGVLLGPGNFAESSAYPDHHAYIREVDIEGQRLLLEFDGGPNDGMEEWWPMTGFNQHGEV